MCVHVCEREREGEKGREAHRLREYRICAPPPPPNDSQGHGLSIMAPGPTPLPSLGQLYSSLRSRFSYPSPCSAPQPQTGGFFQGQPLWLPAVVLCDTQHLNGQVLSCSFGLSNVSPRFPHLQTINFMRTKAGLT